MKVYLISVGEYSDTYIKKVFTDKDMAIRYCAFFNGKRICDWDDEAEIIEMEADDWNVYGEITPYYQYSFSERFTEYDSEYDDLYITTERVNSVTTNSRGEYCITVSLTEKNLDKAKKVGYDLLAKHKAQENGL